MKPAIYDTPINAAPLIDEALRRIGRVELAPGFDARLTTRLAAAAEANRSARIVRFPFAARTGALAAAALATAAMLLVINDHTARKISLPPAVRIVHGGFGSANAVYAPTQPLHATIRGRSGVHPAKGRAVLRPQPARKTPGTAVPRSPFPAESSSPSIPSPTQP
jgi:hypothetical protein